MNCPSPNAPPSLASSIVSTLLQPQNRLFEVLFGLAAILGVIAVRNTWHSEKHGRGRATEGVVLGAFFVLVLGGFFLLVEIADPWGYMLLLWYQQAKATLEAYQCSTVTLENTYENLHPVEQVLSGIGVASIVTGIIILFSYRFVLSRFLDT